MGVGGKQKTGRKGSEKMDDEMERLNEIAKPLMEYLMKNCHPYSAVVVTAERIAVMEVVLSIPKDETH